MVGIIDNIEGSFWKLLMNYNEVNNRPAVTIFNPLRTKRICVI